MKRIRNIIFDFDGTLVDTAPLIIRTMQETMRHMALPMKTDEECKATIGLRLEEIPSVLWPELPGIGEEYALNYRKNFDRLKRPIGVSCFPEVVATLQSLHKAGFRMAIASSRNRSSLEEYVTQFGLGDCFNMVVGGDDVANGKPAPDPVLTIIDRLGWHADETLTVGDAPVDILMGRAAGTWTCAVTYGNGTHDKLEAARPDSIIDSFAQLLED